MTFRLRSVVKRIPYMPFSLIQSPKARSDVIQCGSERGRIEPKHYVRQVVYELPNDAFDAPSHVAVPAVEVLSELTLLANCWKTHRNAVIPIPQKRERNLALKLKTVRDFSSPSAPRNDRLHVLFSILPAYASTVPFIILRVNRIAPNGCFGVVNGANLRLNREHKAVLRVRILSGTSTGKTVAGRPSRSAGSQRTGHRHMIICAEHEGRSNPVRAGLVLHPQDWSWSSFNECGGMSADEQKWRCGLIVERLRMPSDPRAWIWSITSNVYTNECIPTRRAADREVGGLIE